MNRIMHSPDVHRLVSLAAVLLLTACPGCTQTRFFNDLINEKDSSARDTAQEATESESETETGSEAEDTAPGESDSGSETESNSIPECQGSLLERLTLVSIEVDDDIRYGKYGYNYVHLNARIALELSPDGRALVAWMNDSMDALHVTPLTENLERENDDVVFEGADLGGLVAHDDGFAVLTRRPDPGEDIAVVDEDRPLMAAFLVRYVATEETFALPLTGTASFDGELVYCNGFSGQLQWNGSVYGAYFEVRSGQGNVGAGTYWDKLAVIDDKGQPEESGWSRRCGIVRGLLLSPESAGFLALCLSDHMPDPPGLYLTSGIDGSTPALLSAEDFWDGYSGGSFGDVVRAEDGSGAVVWGSRSLDPTMDAHDIAMLRMDDERSPAGEKIWLTSTPDVDEVDVHAAPYGEDHILVVWNAIENLTCNAGTCFGDFAGTNFRLFTRDGEPLGEPEIIPAPPTEDQAIAVHPKGDLIWAFVNDAPDYSKSLVIENLPKQRTIKIARLAYCEE